MANPEGGVGEIGLYLPALSPLAPSPLPCFAGWIPRLGYFIAHAPDAGQAGKAGASGH